MNTFMDRVNAIVAKNQVPQGAPEPVYPDAGIGALENVVSGAPRQTEIMGQPHMLAYINPQEENLLQEYRGDAPVMAGPDGVPAYWFHSSWGGGSKTTSSNNSSSSGGNSFTESIANFFTPNDGASYVGGQLVDSNTGARISSGGTTSTGNVISGIANSERNDIQGPMPAGTDFTGSQIGQDDFGSGSANAAAVNAAVAEAIEYEPLVTNNPATTYTPTTVAPATVAPTTDIKSPNPSLVVFPRSTFGSVVSPAGSGKVISGALPQATTLSGAQRQLNAAISKAQGANSSNDPDVYWNDEIADLAAARDRMRDSGDFDISDGLAETKSYLTLDDSKGSLNFLPDVENTSRENLANLLTPGDNAEYVNGQLVVASGPDKGKSLEGGGYVTNKAGVKDYIYGVSDDFSNNIPVDTTGMSEADAIAARANQQMLQDIPPSDLAYFGSFLPGQVVPIIGSYLGSKMLQSGIEGRRAIVEAETAALAAGAEPRYNDDGEYIGHMTYDDEMANTFGSGNIYTEDYDGASTVNFGNDQSNRFIAGDGASVEGEGSYVTALSDLGSGGDDTTTTTTGGDGGDDGVELDIEEEDVPEEVKEIWKRYYKGSGAQFMPPWLRRWASGESIDLILTKVTLDGKDYYKTKDGRYIEPSELVGTAVSDVDGGFASPFEEETEEETEE